ncbi:MAG: copper amine oxidase N-terminal domain-containing protein, partial [Brevibacillus sp.]
MEKSKKTLPIVLATALVSTPLVANPPSAYAIEDLSVEPEDDTAGEETTYTIDFTLEKDLKKGDVIYIRFPKDFDVSTKIDEDDIDANVDIKKVRVSGRTIEITVDEAVDKGDDISIDIESGITNPDDDGSYTVSVKTDRESSWEDYKVKIYEDSKSSSGKSSEFDVSINRTTEGDTAKYELGPIKLKDKLTKGDWITVYFPDEDMLPNKISTDDVDINEYEPDDVRISGKKVELKVPSKAAGSKSLTITFYEAAG